MTVGGWGSAKELGDCRVASLSEESEQALAMTAKRGGVVQNSTGLAKCSRQCPVPD